jgi:hypothetical protein
MPHYPGSYLYNEKQYSTQKRMGQRKGNCGFQCKHVEKFILEVILGEEIPTEGRILTD